MQTYVMALDGGTGSVRAVIFNQNGTFITSASREWTHVELKDHPGSMQFDTDKNWALTVECIQEVLKKIPVEKITAIACTSMREGIAVYDKHGVELWACANVDARSVEQVHMLREKGQNFEMEVYAKSGQTFALGAAPRLLWLKQYEPEIYREIYFVTMLSDWFAVRLGAPIVIDPSNGGTTGLFDIRERQWSEELISKCDLDTNMFHARVAESGTQIGTVSKDAAKITGLKEGTIIAMGGGDAQLGSIGVGAVTSGDVAMFGGSFWQQEVCLDSPVDDPEGKLRINFHAVHDMWQVETIAFMVGLTLRWFRDALCPDIVADAMRQGVDPYYLLDKMAKEVPPGSYGIIPIFSDSMYYMHWRHAAPSFLNLGVDSSIYTRGALFRALMENAAIVAKANLKQILDVTGITPEKIFFAGGASKSNLWIQILADVLQIPIVVPKVEEATALGAAMCAASAVRESTTIKQIAREWVVYKNPVYPNVENKEVYEQLYEQWKAAYPCQLKLADEGITKHMWQAPGE
jgi:autoinducer 2 (AI-2) kinase